MDRREGKMRRYKLVVANWKMNLSVPESTVLLEKYLGDIKPGQTEVVVCPSYLEIYSASKVLTHSDISVGAQDVFYEDSGAYTGEVSADMLKGFVGYAIVGHSERRAHFGESDKIVAKKAAALIRHGITPIICVGETLHEKMDGLTKLVVAGQVEASLSDLTGEEIAKSVIAYEPVWAIGTGHVCEPKKANEVISNIRNLIKVLHGEKVADEVRIIYGGSVNDKNVASLAKEAELDGFLVGGASLDPNIFSKICNVYSDKSKTLDKKDKKKKK
jgi:triosephosphate isomerase